MEFGRRDRYTGIKMALDPSLGVVQGRLDDSLADSKLTCFSLLVVRDEARVHTVTAESQLPETRSCLRSIRHAEARCLQI